MCIAQRTLLNPNLLRERAGWITSYLMTTIVFAFCWSKDSHVKIDFCFRRTSQIPTRIQGKTRINKKLEASKKARVFKTLWFLGMLHSCHVCYFFHLWCSFTSCLQGYSMSSMFSPQELEIYFIFVNEMSFSSNITITASEAIRKMLKMITSNHLHRKIAEHTPG